MSKNKFLQLCLSLSIALVVAFVGVTTVLADPPANDDISSATLVSTLPFNDTNNTSQATPASDDPFPTCHASREASVWYTYIPAENQHVKATTTGSDYATVLAVFTGSPGSLNEIACSYYNRTVRFQAQAGTTYYFMVSSAGEYPYPPGISGGQLDFQVDLFNPPENDDRVDAVVLDTFPANY